ncbi:FAD-dependent monooxygenase [Novosphingobium terrae]|uniref:FAD-dependent monooxygenase n=1 Tax=Novosphingobium terrae TaxID=2726189 RepID=UPI001981736A|nr:FAD-dependent monooxygenase [Novosphingobium terrae]
MSDEIRRALIVGAGPGGLSAASALTLAGFSVDVVERTPDHGVLGSELHVMSACLRALDLIGVAEAVAAAGVKVESASFIAANGQVLGTHAFEQMARPGLPTGVGISRRVLHRTLYDRAIELGATVTHEMSVQALEDQPDGRIRATRSDGSSDIYDLVVGADGVNSSVRALRFPEAPKPAYAGQCVWRASVPRQTEAVLYSAIGSKAVPGLISVSEDENYLFCLVTYDQPPRPDKSEYKDMVHEALADFDGVFGEARDQVDGIRHIHFAPLLTTLQPLPWNRGNVVLIGDAVHATTPHLGYGAGLAMEDGVALADSLKHASSIPDGLKAFGERRFERCRAVVETGLKISRWQQNPTPGFNQGAEIMRVWDVLRKPI